MLVPYHCVDAVDLFHLPVIKVVTNQLLSWPFKPILLGKSNRKTEGFELQSQMLLCLCKMVSVLPKKTVRLRRHNRSGFRSMQHIGQSRTSLEHSPALPFRASRRNQ
jgi:hypothetical protein